MGKMVPGSLSDCYSWGKKTKKTCVLNKQTTRRNVSDDEPAATF